LRRYTTALVYAPRVGLAAASLLLDAAAAAAARATFWVRPA